MKPPLTLKLVFRSWKQNSLFAIVSIISLAIGIACTNLLIMFVIHEYNIEGNNPNKNRILSISQDHPMKEGQRVTYAQDATAPLIKEQFGEVEEFLRIGTIRHYKCKVNQKIFEPLLFVHTEPSFPKFFPYESSYGRMEDVLGKPDVIAITENTAARLFGKENPIGKTITFNMRTTVPIDQSSAVQIVNVDKSFQVGAVLKNRNQSYLKFDILLTHPAADSFGGPTLFLMKQPTDKNVFADKVNQANIPTLLPGKGKYYFQTLQESYFDHFTGTAFKYIQHREETLLKIGFASALFILLIACFNYVNLNFSRMLQQIKTIHIQKLMGATHTHIRRQLFTDTFLTISLAFLLSILLVHDFLPVFNRIVSSEMEATFLYNKQVLPIIISFVILLSVVPALYISSHLPKISGNNYKRFYTGKKKRQIVSFLVIMQFIISIGLIISSMVVNNQIHITKQGGELYKNVIELGNQFSSPAAPIKTKIENIPGVKSATICAFSMLHGILRDAPLRGDDGSEVPGLVQLISGGSNFFQTFPIRILEGDSWETLNRKNKKAILVNEKFVEKYVPQGESPIGKPLKLYDVYADSTRLIGGITENFFINSLEEEIPPIEIYPAENGNYLLVRTDGKNTTATIEKIREIWVKHNPDQYFSYEDMYRTFLAWSKHTFEFSKLLLMYSLISIFLTCFGLFGMALYATEQRTKEIGIRKINGASTSSILLLLNKQFIGWVTIAFIIAFPFTWHALNRWLEHYVYRTEITVWICLLAALIVIGITLLTVSWHTYKAASKNPILSIKSE